MDKGSKDLKLVSLKLERELYDRLMAVADTKYLNFTAVTKLALVEWLEKEEAK